MNISIPLKKKTGNLQITSLQSENPNTNTGLFGDQQNMRAAQSETTAPNPVQSQRKTRAGSGFGKPRQTTMSSQTQRAKQQRTPSLFGPSNTAANTNLFRAASGEMTGSVVKFNPLTGSDTMVKNGITRPISTRHYCITCMKEYEGKSLEELRLEDYVAGRKGQAQGAQTTGMFGSLAQPSIFGFGAATASFGATSQPATTTGSFGKPITGFGATATTSSTFFFNSTTTTSNPFGSNAQAKPLGAAAPTPLFGSTNTTQPAATAFGTNNTNAFESFGAPQANQNIGHFNQNKPPFNMPASTAGTGFSGFGQNTATNTTGGLSVAKPAGTAAFDTTPLFGATPAPAFGTNTGFGTAPATGSLFNSSFKPAGQTGFSFGTTPATSTGLGISSGVNFGTGSSIVAPQKPSGFSDISGTNLSSNSTNAFPLKNDFSVEDKTSAPRSNPAGECIGSHPTPVSNQVNKLVVASTLDKTPKYSKSKNSATQTVINPQFQEGTNKSSPNAEIQAINETQPSENSLSKEEEEGLAVKEFFQSPKVAKAETIVPPPTTISTKPLSALLPVQNIESPNSKSDAKEGANKENQTLTNSIDIQTYPQSLSKSVSSSTNGTQSAATVFGINNTNAFGSFGASQSNQNIGLSNQNKLRFNMPASTASTGFSGFSQNTATNTTEGLFGAQPAGTATSGTTPSFGATPAPALGTNTSFGTAPATGSLFESSFKPAGQTGFSFWTTPATPTALVGISSGVNSGTGSSIVASRKPGGFFDIPKTNMSSNSTNAFPLKNDFSVGNKTTAPRSNPAGECIGSHPTSILNQVNESVVALALDKTEKCLESENSGTQTSSNPRSQVGPKQSSLNAELPAVKKTQPSEKSLCMGKKEVPFLLQEFFQSLKVAKAEEIVSPPTTIRTRPLSALLPVQNIESPNSKSDAKEGVNRENQTPTNSTDVQTDLQCLSKSTMSLSVSDGTLNATPNVDKSLFSSSYSSATSHKLDVTSVMSSHRKQRPNVACNTPRCAGYYVIPPLEKLDEYVCGHTCMIPNFTRGFKGYGNYYQPHLFDIYSLDFDEIVHFRNEKIIIYPYDDQRPPIGQYLDHRVKALTDDMIATDSPGLILITSKWSRLSRR